MKLSQPKFITWLIALILGVVGLIGYLIGALLDPQLVWLMWVAFILLVVGLVLLLIANAIKGL